MLYGGEAAEVISHMVPGDDRFLCAECGKEYKHLTRHWRYHPSCVPEWYRRPDPEPEPEPEPELAPDPLAARILSDALLYKNLDV